MGFAQENKDYKDVVRSICFQKSNIVRRKKKFANYTNSELLKKAFNLKANLIKLYSCDCSFVLINSFTGNTVFKNQLCKVPRHIRPKLCLKTSLNLSTCSGSCRTVASQSCSLSLTPIQRDISMHQAKVWIYSAVATLYQVSVWHFLAFTKSTFAWYDLVEVTLGYICTADKDVTEICVPALDLLWTPLYTDGLADTSSQGTASIFILLLGCTFTNLYSSALPQLHCYQFKAS